MVQLPTADVEDVREQFDADQEDSGPIEGWALFDWDGTGLMQIQRIDQDGAFASDDEAIAFVRQQAEAGSASHATALIAHDSNRVAIGSRKGLQGTSS
jgi:hypothetical protein